MRVRRFKARRQHRVSAIEFLESRCLLTGPGDLVGDTLALATDFGSLAPGRFFFDNGAIDVAGDLDVYRFQTVTPGLVAIALNADHGPLDTVVKLRDSFGDEVAFNNDFDPPFSTDSFLTFFVQGGRTYFVETGGLGSSTGSFSLDVYLDVIDAFPESIVPLGPLTAEVPIQLNDSIGFAGEFDLFEFQALSDGPATFQLNSNSSGLDSVVTLLDSSGTFLATNDDFKPPLKDSSLTYAVHSGETYYLVASGFRSSTGGYALSVSLPAVVDLGVLSVAQPQVQYSDMINVTGDIDVFQFQASSSCLLTVQLDADHLNSLDPVVTLLDSTGAQLQRDDDNGVGFNSYLTYSIAGNQTYYLVAGGVGASTGAYTLTVSRPTAIPLGVLSVTHPLLQDGSIAVVGESDFYQFQAQTTGFALVELSAGEFSDLDTVVTVLDSNGAFLTFSDDIDFPDNSNSSLTFAVVAGQTYFIQAEGYVPTTGAEGFSTGDYSLSVSLPMVSDLGNLTSTQSLMADGAITFAGESDFYQIHANAGGILVLELNPTAPQTLDTTVALRNSSGNVVAFNDDVNFPSQKNSRLTYIVSANATYFIEASGFGISTGGYHLNASLITDNISDIATELTAFPLGTLSSTRPLQTTSAIEAPLDRDVFQFHVDTASLVDIQLNAQDSGTLDTILRVLDSSGNQIAFNDDIRFPSNTNSRLSFSAQANQTYFIDVSGFRNSVGTYTLSAGVIPVQSITSLAFPTPNTPTQVSGTIGAVGVISQFRVAPAVSNQVLRIEVNAANSSLDPVVAVRVLSATGVVTSTASDDDSGPGLNSLLSVSILAGQFLEIDVRGFGLSTGAFSLTISTAAANNNFTPLSNNDLRFDSISQPYEQDIFRFTATIPGQVVIDLVAADRFFDPVLTVVRNSTGAVVGSNDDSPFNFLLANNPMISAANVPITSLNSHLEINVTAADVLGHATFDIFARDFSFHTGRYFLAATQVTQDDDFVDAFDALNDLRRGNATRNIQFNDRHELDPVITGRITAATANRNAQDIDLLDFQPNFTGVLDLTINRDSGLNVAMSVFRDIRQPGAGVGDYELVDVLMPGATMLSIPVDQMGIYVVRVVGLSGDGNYRLSGGVRTDPVPDSIATTESIEFNAPLTTPTQAINFAHDRDVYRFVAPSAGLVSVSLSQTTGSRLDPLLTILDNKGVPIASNDDVNFGAEQIDSLVTFQAVAGAVYYIQAEGIGATFGNYSLAVTSANLATATARSAGTPGDSDIERALLEAATTGLLSIANGAGMNGDRSPTAIGNAIVEAIATLAKQGKLSSNYIVLILDDAPEAGFVLTDGLGMQTVVHPDSGVTLPPGGGIVNSGQFAVVAIVPTTGGGVPTLQVSGFGSNLGSSFQASMVTRSGDSQSLTQQLVSRSTAGEKVQLTFSLGFGFEAITNRSVPAGQTPSFFLMTNAFSKTSDRSNEAEEASVLLANTDIEENLRTSLSFDPLDPEAWQSLFEGVLQNLQFEGLPRTSLGNVLNRFRASENTVPTEVVKNSPVVRSARAVYEVLKQGAGWIGTGTGQRKTPATTPKPRTPAPKVTQETSIPRIAPQARIASKKLTHLGG